jgi:membrane protein implicated in regulation of membrane protease activity
VDTATVLFLIIGGVGMVLLILGLLGVEMFDIDGFVPLEVVAAMLGAFGFAAAIASSLMGAGIGTALVGSIAIGVGVSAPVGWLTTRLVRATRQMETDATPTRDDLLGTMGVVVTPVPAQGYGEIRITLGGQPVKLSATSGRELALGTEVFVIATNSETSVVVEQIPAGQGDAPAA